MNSSKDRWWPLAPDSTTGWPWTRQGPSSAESTDQKAARPGISIVTPSFNQGGYIEETIRSVLLQGYPNLEYIIIDGGSTDNTLEIIKKYEDHLAFWVSELDAGQSQAINKGFQRATGDIFAYINSDDYYMPGVFFKVAAFFHENKESELIAGNCDIVENGEKIREFKAWQPKDAQYLLRPFGSPFAQPASFWTRKLHEEVGGFNEDLHYCLDREFFLRAALAGYTPHIMDETLAAYRIHPGIKTDQTIQFYLESLPIIEKYAEDCGLNIEQKKSMIRNVQKEINFLQVYIEWKNSGRRAAAAKFMSMIKTYPEMLKERKVLGQARRLIMFPADKVSELKNV